MSTVAIASIAYVQEPGLVPATSPLPYPVSATLSASPGIAPRPGTAASRLPVCLAVYRDPLKEGRGTGLGIGFL